MSHWQPPLISPRPSLPYIVITDKTRLDNHFLFQKWAPLLNEPAAEIEPLTKMKTSVTFSNVNVTQTLSAARNIRRNSCESDIWVKVRLTEDCLFGCFLTFILYWRAFQLVAFKDRVNFVKCINQCFLKCFLSLSFAFPLLLFKLLFKKLQARPTREILAVFAFRKREVSWNDQEKCWIWITGHTESFDLVVRLYRKHWLH